MEQPRPDLTLLGFALVAIAGFAFGLLVGLVLR